MVVLECIVADGGDGAGDGDGGELVGIKCRVADGGDCIASNSTRYIYSLRTSWLA